MTMSYSGEGMKKDMLEEGERRRIWISAVREEDEDVLWRWWDKEEDVQEGERRRIWRSAGKEEEEDVLWRWKDEDEEMLEGEKSRIWINTVKEEDEDVMEIKEEKLLWFIHSCNSTDCVF